MRSISSAWLSPLMDSDKPELSPGSSPNRGRNSCSALHLARFSVSGCNADVTAMIGENGVDTKRSVAAPIAAAEPTLGDLLTQAARTAVPARLYLLLQLGLPLAI